ncbi:MAG: hypothetical protein R3B09_06435 [Nannocystaceae bacterium]
MFIGSLQRRGRTAGRGAPRARSELDARQERSPRPVDHALEVDGFCVGVAAGDLAQGTALGLAVDDVAPPLHQSFFRVNGFDACNTGTEYRDFAVVTPYPTAQWCIDVDVAPG